jgi:hypothetical protein
MQDNLFMQRWKTLFEGRRSWAELTADALLAGIDLLRSTLILRTYPVASDVVAAQANLRHEGRFCPADLPASGFRTCARQNDSKEDRQGSGDGEQGRLAHGIPGGSDGGRWRTSHLVVQGVGRPSSPGSH